MDMIYKFALGIILLMAFSGCEKRVDVDAVVQEVMEKVRSGDQNLVVEGSKLAEATLQKRLVARTSNDSLAYADSIRIAYLYEIRTGYYYHTTKDTMMAILSFMETLPWTRVWEDHARAQWWRFYANDVGEALVSTKNPYLAEIAYTAFLEAEHYALRAGDTDFHAEVLRTKQEFAERLVTLPDSVRLAFAPAPPASSPSPWSFAAIALVVGFIVGGGSWTLYRNKSKLTFSHKRKPTGSTLDILDALWTICNDVSSVPQDVLDTVNGVCRKTTHQRAMFIQAGLMARVSKSDEPDPKKVAGTVRSRLLRYFKSRQWEMMPGVRLPRDRDEWYLWFNNMGCTHCTPSEILQEERTDGTD